MADILDLMLATRTRIDEVLALRWSDIALDAERPHLTISGTIKSEPDRGTYRKATPKSDSTVRAVALPPFAAAALTRRRTASSDNPIDAVFPTRNGTWHQVNNVARRWREIRKGTCLVNRL